MKTDQLETPPLPLTNSDQNSGQKAPADPQFQKPIEIGGPKGPEPTRYGDWEKAGRCSDF